mmetsp:Transcript_29213/g.84587  ORF Transcript_29213/g.84587 Transcript_29213/m.84587 type:complete len:351 (+) Transcript_29213:104-1156(+)
MGGSMWWNQVFGVTSPRLARGLAAQANTPDAWTRYTRPDHKHMLVKARLLNRGFATTPYCQKLEAPSENIPARGFKGEFRERAMHGPTHANRRALAWLLGALPRHHGLAQLAPFPCTPGLRAANSSRPKARLFGSSHRAGGRGAAPLVGPRLVRLWLLGAFSRLRTSASEATSLASLAPGHNAPDNGRQSAWSRTRDPPAPRALAPTRIASVRSLACSPAATPSRPSASCSSATPMPTESAASPPANFASPRSSQTRSGSSGPPSLWSLATMRLAATLARTISLTRAGTRDHRWRGGTQAALPATPGRGPRARLRDVPRRRRRRRAVRYELLIPGSSGRRACHGSHASAA